MDGEFPGGAVVMNLPCNARGTGWGAEIPQAAKQLSLHAMCCN